MTQKIVVTDAQVKAAQMIVDHDRATGRETDEATLKIAEAKPQPTTADRFAAVTQAVPQDAAATASASSAPPLVVAEPTNEQPGAEPRRSQASGRSSKFVLSTGTTGKFHFNLVAGNGHVIATSEDYETKEEALESIKSVQPLNPAQIESEE